MTFQKSQKKIKLKSKPAFRKNSKAIVKSFLLKEKGYKFFKNLTIRQDDYKLSSKKEALATYYKVKNVNSNELINGMAPKVEKKKAIHFQPDFLKSKLSYYFFKP